VDLLAKNIMDKKEVLVKIIKLLALSKSSNENEASAAKSAAEALMIKYNILDSEIESVVEKTLYTDNELLYSSLVVIPWKSRLAFITACKYEMFVIQEVKVPKIGNPFYIYFIYGDFVSEVKELFDLLLSKIEGLIISNCKNKEDDYIDSYCEGVVEGIASCIKSIVFKTSSKIEEAETNSTDSLSKKDDDLISKKEKPLKESIDVNQGSNIKDIAAYFLGISHGLKLDFN